MTTDRRMAKAYPAQGEVIAALHAIGDADLAYRLERCPGMAGWYVPAAAATRSLAIIPLHSSAGQR